jgi:AGZA family xanthine/uracil permease-like MFS transporter
VTGKINQWFRVQEAGTTVSREVRAGVTTFLAMAYILVVNPQILSPAIIIPGVADVSAQLVSATAIAAALGSILMGIMAGLPVALAPGMGLNAYFTYSAVLGQGLSWQTALGAVFVSGVVFLILTISGIREAIINAIPLSIKRASSAGIGMFLALIGLQSGGLVRQNATTMIGLGDLTSPGALLAILGLVVTAALLVRKVPGAILIGIFMISAITVVGAIPVYDGKAFSGFENGIVSWPVWPRDLFGAFNLRGALDLSVFGVVFTFLFIAFFDTAGTLIGLSEVAKFSDQEGRVPRASQAFAADAAATTLGAVIGTSTTTVYMESAAGIEDGGRTGLVAVVTGILFLLSLFFWPLASAVPTAATAPALIILGAMLMEPLARIAWKDLSEAIPAFVTMIMMPLTFSIANGISLGVFSYVTVALLSKKSQKIHPVMYGILVVLVLKYVWLAAKHS